MHWTYKSEADTPLDLEQGDILKKTNYLVDEVLTKYHPYYATNKDNEFFIVLTQSCDLVKREGVCKTPYITLAPIRPLRVIVEREFHCQLSNLKPKAQAFGSNRLKDSYEDFLRKLFNNNDSKYFFILEQQDKLIAEDMCAVTTLSISIKIEHYDECMKARILQLDDTFQAKLGWLVGQQYSRVGTPDWPEEELSQKIGEAISKTAVWVKDEIVERVQKDVLAYENGNLDAIVDGDKLAEIIKNIPEKKDQVIDSIFEVLIEHNLIDTNPSTAKFALRKAFKNSKSFSKFFRS